MKKIKITEGQYRLLKENLDAEDIGHLKSMIYSGQQDNIDLAFSIIKSQGGVVKSFLSQNCKDLVLLLKQLEYKTSSEDIAEFFTINSLDLSGIKLDSLPEFLDRFSNLKKLWLDDTGIKDLSNLFKLSSLNFLSLCSNQLTALPENIGNLTNLTELVLSFNRFTFLPETIKSIHNLTDLWITGNDFEFLPEWIGNLTNLESLSVSKNNLDYLPEEIGKLVNLKKLYLYDNNLTFLPKEISNLRNLKYLKLGDEFSSQEMLKIQKMLPNCKVDF